MCFDKENLGLENQTRNGLCQFYLTTIRGNRKADLETHVMFKRGRPVNQRYHESRTTDRYVLDLLFHMCCICYHDRRA